jgi:hypothetical protein
VLFTVLLAVGKFHIGATLFLSACQPPVLWDAGYQVDLTISYSIIPTPPRQQPNAIYTVSSRSHGIGQTLVPHHVVDIDLKIMAESKKEVPTGEELINDPDVAIGETEPYLQELATLKADGANLMFEAQAALLNHAVQKIGMGKYQWGLFVLAGYGWLCDQVNCTQKLKNARCASNAINAEDQQLWQTTVSDALPQVGIEFDPAHPAFLSLALIAGLVVGAGFWGFGADLIGRRLVFNTTLFIAGVFGIAAGGANSFVTCAVLCSFVGFGVGGNRTPIQSISPFT